MTENYHVNKHKTRSILMQDINLCDNKTQHYEQKLTFATDVKNVCHLQRHKHRGAYATASLH